jgi:hypothetical protein
MRPLHVPVAGPAPARQPGWRAVAGVAAAGLLAGGRAGAGPVGLLAVGPLAVALGSAATGRLVAAWGRSPWWGLSFALVPGVVVGVAFATAEPLALALAALGLSLVLDRRPVPAGLAFAGAALTKESYLAFAVAAAAWLAIGGGRRRARLAGAAAVVVPGLALLGLWWAYVAWRIPPSAADAEAAGAVGPPLAGAARPCSAGPGSCSACTGCSSPASCSAGSSPACVLSPPPCSPPSWPSWPSRELPGNLQARSRPACHHAGTMIPTADGADHGQARTPLE